MKKNTFHAWRSGNFSRTAMADAFMNSVRKKMEAEGRDFDKEVKSFKERVKDAAVQNLKSKLTGGKHESVSVR